MNDVQSGQGIRDEYLRQVNRLAKWRTVFVGWIWGTMQKDDPGAPGRRDLIEKVLLLRAETSALAILLANKGVFTYDEFRAQIADECRSLQVIYEGMFPGFRSGDDGISMDVQVVAETMKRLRFKP